MSTVLYSSGQNCTSPFSESSKSSQVTHVTSRLRTEPPFPDGGNGDVMS